MRPDHQIKKFLGLIYKDLPAPFFYLIQTPAHLLFLSNSLLSLQLRAMNLHVSYDPTHGGKSKGTEKKYFFISTVQGHNPYSFLC